MTRITKEPEERRQEILDAAMKLFYEKGYEKTSIADIAKAMHVAQGLCYRYFPSKEALLDTAVDQYASVLAERLSSVFKQPGLTAAQLVERMPSFLETEQDGSAASRVCHGPGGKKIHDQLSLSLCGKLVPVVRAWLEQARDRGELRVRDPETAASFCVYGQLGILLNTELPGEERVRRVKEFLLELLEQW